ncbi:MAG TPA: bifunctional acetate--CoA ligase family protein/GNAT family N-acetyltransferase [Burkholderiales bacterium]|nr:bifunctional acetate--CoA ligase family protein/GNAT family N-acetyltransferase [Burkholderiales bacterium]
MIEKHYLRPLLAPRSVALVGATEREGALGRIVWRNLSQGGLRGPLYAVNLKHDSVFGQPVYRRLDKLPQPPELAVIATPAASVPALVREAGKAGIKAAVVLSAGFAESGASGRALQLELVAAAREGGVRVLGPNCLGLMRADAGLNASFARNAARPGKLALVSQSGAICGALLDWAEGAHVGFTSVVSLGAAADLDFGEILDFLIADSATEAILLYMEGIRDARRALSALRAAARVKPVVALKVGRSASGTRAVSSHTGALVGSDAVFDAALRRSGTVRVKTYIQLFAAARMLSNARMPHGERLAIVTNGGGPGVIAADSAAENGVPLARIVDLLGDATPQRFADGVRDALADPGADAVLAMYSPVAVTAPQDAARAVVEAAASLPASGAKPLLGAWLGDMNANESREFLEAHGIPNFRTPETAIEAFSFLSIYRRNQALLMQVPAARARPQIAAAPDLARADALREAALREGRTLLTEREAKALLSAFGLPVPRSILAATRAAALEAAREIGLPVALKIQSPDLPHKTDVGGVRLHLQTPDMVASAYDDMLRHVRALRPQARLDGVLVQPMLRFPAQREVLVGIATDAVFGPVVTFGSGGIAVEALRDAAVALPPLNAFLAHELIERTRASRLLDAYRDVPAADREALVDILCGVSRLACLAPWVKELDINPVIAHPGGAVIADARVVIDPAQPARAGRHYPHMAIHPYPVELEGEVALRDGRRVPVRPMRPDDVDLELRFFERLSPQARYQRFMQHLPRLSPRMLARFTQLDYDRELALVALHEGEFIAVGRYSPESDGVSAEFALTVADAWQGKGLGRALLQMLCEAARDAGYEALYGYILEANREMLELARRLDFHEASRTGTDVTVVRRLK